MIKRWPIVTVVLGVLLCLLLSIPLARAQSPPSDRPVVMVHGFGSNWQAWEQYLGADGYLASVGLQGFAVGDGQVEGTLNTGNPLRPQAQTNTIAENAAILGEYIENVKAATGAEQVDLIAHSMGGLISRYYVDRVMDERDVAQLIMLGSPQRGTACANLPAAAGLQLPATLELRPSYVENLFNRQITRRQGVPFYILAGTRIVEPVGSPCAAVPSDIVISQESATGISATVTEMPVLHTELNTSPRVFDEFVRPLLLRATTEIPTVADPPAPDTEQTEPLQFTRVYTGHISSGEVETRTINIDQVTVASFALYDPTRSLTVTVRGATGNIIALSPITHALTVIDDPDTLLYLGYGFNNPKPGPWRVTLQTTDATPSEGADYALTARYEGGARVEAQSSTLLAAPDEEVVFTATLALAGEPLPIEVATARIVAPNGEREQVALEQSGPAYRGVWRPTQPGVHGVDIFVEGRTPDDVLLERTAFLAVEVQQSESESRMRLLGLALTAVVVLVGLVIVWRRRG